MISIRNATDADVDDIVRLVNTAFLVEQFFIERDRTDPEMVRGLMKKGSFLLAEGGANPRGLHLCGAARRARLSGNVVR